jgi:hypothetical protein
MSLSRFCFFLVLLRVGVFMMKTEAGWGDFLDSGSGLRETVNQSVFAIVIKWIPEFLLRLAPGRRGVL